MKKLWYKFKYRNCQPKMFKLTEAEASVLRKYYFSEQFPGFICIFVERHGCGRLKEKIAESLFPFISLDSFLGKDYRDDRFLIRKIYIEKLFKYNKLRLKNKN